MTETARGRTLAIAAGAVAVAVALVIVTFSIQDHAAAPPGAPPFTATNDSSNGSLTFHSIAGVGGAWWHWMNVSSTIVLNASGLKSSFSMDVQVQATASPTDDPPGIGEVFFLFYANISGELASPLSPSGVTLVADDLNNSSGEYDHVIVANFLPYPEVAAVNISSDPYYIDTDGFTGNGSITDYAALSNSSSQRQGAFEFTLPIQFQAQALPIPANSTAVNTFHLKAYLDGLGQTVFCEATVEFSDSYSQS
jgi:hypothetical protein